MTIEYKTMFLVFDVGCIECGEPSQVVGAFDTEEEAQAERGEYLDGGTRWGRTGWNGQHTVEIHPVEIPMDG